MRTEYKVHIILQALFILTLAFCMFTDITWLNLGAVLSLTALFILGLVLLSQSNTESSELYALASFCARLIIYGGVSISFYYLIWELLHGDFYENLYPEHCIRDNGFVFGCEVTVNFTHPTINFPIIPFVFSAIIFVESIFRITRRKANTDFLKCKITLASSFIVAFLLLVSAAQHAYKANERQMLVQPRTLSDQDIFELDNNSYGNVARER